MLSGLLGTQSWLHIISCLITGFLPNSTVSQGKRGFELQKHKQKQEATFWLEWWKSASIHKLAGALLATQSHQIIKNYNIFYIADRCK